MRKLTLDEQKKLESLFVAFERDNILYVIPRGHEHLPLTVDGGDIDIFISSIYFSRAISICREFGFRSKSLENSKLLALIKKAVINPKRFITLALSSPKTTLGTLKNYLSLKPSENIGSNYLEIKLYFNNIMIHLFNNLAYTSPLSGSKIMVNPAINHYMFEGRKKQKFYYAPSPPDELVHLVCRGIFDYSGEFPDYYLSRCETLASGILANKQQERSLKDLLKLTFFKADGIVYEHIIMNQYVQLKSDLLKFSEY